MAAVNASLAASTAAAFGNTAFYWRQLNMQTTASLRLLTTMQTCLWIVQSVHENYSYLLNDLEKSQLEKFATSLARNMASNLEDLTTTLHSLDTPAATVVLRITDELDAALAAMLSERLGLTGQSLSENSPSTQPLTSPNTYPKNILPFKPLPSDTRRSRACRYDRE